MRPLIPVLLALLLAGCGTPAMRFEAVGPGGDLGSRARYRLEAPEGAVGSITISARGRVEDEVEGRSTDTVRFEIVVDNGSDAPLHLDLEGLEARDDRDRRLPRLRLYLPPDSGEKQLTVPPGTRTSVDLLVDAGGPDTLRTTGSITLQWSYSLRGKKVSHRTRFLPIRYERRVYYHSGFWYHHYHYHPHHYGFYCW